MADILEQIIARKRERLEEAKRRLPQEQLLAELPTVIGGGRLGFALRRNAINIIAEIKRASPSKNDIDPTADAAERAKTYETSGAATISILTEPTYFKGSLDDIRDARRAVDIPLLRKDFIVDEVQIYEAAIVGADAVLLIVAALSEADLAYLLTVADSLGLDTLV